MKRRDLLKAAAAVPLLGFTPAVTSKPLPAPART
jgi:hypothetical protein